MSVTEDDLQYRRLQAPQEDGAVFCDPPPGAIDDRLADNLQRQTDSSSAIAQAYAQYDCQGRSLEDLARQARQELLTSAVTYTSSYGTPTLAGATADPTAPLIMTGHQPQLFHPGVWCKNFAAARLAAQQGGVAVHLIIDSDVCKSRAVRVPGGTVTQPVVRSVPLDEAARQHEGLSIPYEELAITDAATFDTFGHRASEVLKPLVKEPLLRDFWPQVVARRQQTDRLGLCLAQARHQLETDWGLTSLEVPQSRMCGLEAFHWFACHLLAQLPRLVDVYNTSLAEYRRANRIRSSAHPVPDLAMDQRWLEAPFWIWTVENPVRRRLFVQQQGDTLLLSDRGQVTVPLPVAADQTAEAAVAQLVDIGRAGVKLRPRALVTTMFTRLLLCDLFIHGIGGAKYDQLTDLLIERFFGFPPPHFLTLSGTLRLPIPHARTTVDQLHELKQQLRRAEYHPEKYFSEGAVPDIDQRDRWVDHKRKWVATPPTAENGRTRYLEIRRSNEALRGWASDVVRRLQDELQQTRAAMRGEAILSSREYPFCFFPQKILQDYLLDIQPHRL
ncbi:MAG: hypothetical protein OES79_09910 [Planctomycetota bacterium]|nr:hypothetical protein [Planctomycetota bacterium]